MTSTSAEIERWPDALQALLHPVRGRRAGVDVADHASGEAAAAFRVGDAHREGFVDHVRHRRNLRAAASFARVSAATSRATPSTDRQSARLGVSLMRDQLVVEGVVLAEVAADRRVRRQREQAAVVVGEAQLARRAQHALAFDAAHLRGLDLEGLVRRFARQLRTDERAGHFHAGGDVRRAADDGKRRTGSGVHAADGQTVGVGMLARPRAPAPPPPWRTAARRRSQVSTSSPDIVSR